MVVVGSCRLCLKESTLQDSHFIPQAAYRLVRGEGKNPHPLVVQTDKVVQTFAQTRAHLFCRDCEQRFHKGGEDAFFRLCYRGPGKFKLLDRLRANLPRLEDSRKAVYLTEPSDDAALEQLGFFAISLFWKSSVQAWNDGIAEIPSIRLGPYQEHFRRFLLGQEPFPADAALIVELSDETNRLIQVIGSPGSLKVPTNYVHWIHLCGFRFNLVVGQRMPRGLKRLCVFKPSPKVLIVSKDEETDMVNLYRGLLKSLAGTIPA